MPPAEDISGRLRGPILNAAIQLQILDPREVNYFITPQEPVETVLNDLLILRQRREELRDAPPVEDSAMLPDRDAALGVMNFILDARNYLELIQAIRIRDREIIQDLRDDLSRRYQLWDAIRDAKFDLYYVWVRRTSLAKLRDSLGPEAYYRGEWPAPLP